MKKFKIYICIILTYLLFSSYSYAYCNFEVVGMGTSIEELSSKVADVNLSGLSNDPTETKFTAANACSDPEFENITLTYEYIDKKLVRIQFNDYNPSINHLKNLIYHYGDPMISNEVLFGINYYHWDLSFRDVFLNIEIDREGQVLHTSLVITVNDYANKLRKYQSYD